MKDESPTVPAISHPLTKRSSFLKDGNVGLAQMGELLANASWNSTAWLVVACILSMLAVRFMPVSPGPAPRPAADGASSPWRFAGVVAVTAWGALS